MASAWPKAVRGHAACSHVHAVLSEERKRWRKIEKGEAEREREREAEFERYREIKRKSQRQLERQKERQKDEPETEKYSVVGWQTDSQKNKKSPDLSHFLISMV